jgi:hypothetical protein
MLATQIDELHPYYLPIDVPEFRDICIGIINQDFDWELDPKGWPIIGKGGLEEYSDKELTNEHHAMLDPVIQEHSDFFGRWYKIDS